MQTIIAGNWKMNMAPREAAALMEEIVNGMAALDHNDDLKVVVCPPTISISEVVGKNANSQVEIGGQNMHFADSGAYTGEVSADMLLQAGCRYVLLGHSERRHVFGEDDTLINRKTLKALEAGLIPVLCVGETEADRDQGLTFNVIERQLKKGLLNVSPQALSGMVIAYEPVWAIGTGRTATPEQAQEVHFYIRHFLKDIPDAEAETIPLLYGGSVKPSNVDELLGQPDVNGALVGGASLKSDSFLQLVKAGYSSK